MKVTMEISKEIVRKAKLMILTELDEEKDVDKIVALDNVSASDEPVYVDLLKLEDSKDAALGIAMIALIQGSGLINDGV